MKAHCLCVKTLIAHKRPTVLLSEIHCSYPLLTVLIDLLDDLIQLLSCRVLAQHPHHGTQLLGADITATVGVKHVEGGLEFWKNPS